MTDKRVLNYSLALAAEVALASKHTPDSPVDVIVKTPETPFEDPPFSQNMNRKQRRKARKIARKS